MDEMIKKEETLPAVLEGYVAQGQMFLSNAALNLMQFGRVLTEAKPRVPHGAFGNWVRENFRMSERTAQQYMAVWKRFGGKAEFDKVQFSSLQKMLALPEGKEEDFVRENDLEEMTVRQVEARVKAALEEAQEAHRIEKAKLEEQVRRETVAQSAQAIREARQERDEAKGALAGYAQEKAQWAAERRDFALKLQETQQQEARARAQAEKAMAAEERLMQERADLESALEDTQAEYNRLQGELLDAQSSLAKGDAERQVTGSLSCGEFAGAVRSFLGAVSQMPYMAATFAETVDAVELRQWEESLRSVEDWAARARKALNTVEGGIVHG